MNNIISPLQAVTIQVLLALLFLQLAANEVDGFRYEVSNDNSITITGYNGPGGDVVIPSEINGIPVRSVGHRAFMESPRNHDRMLTSVRFPEGITSVGREAFRDNRRLRDVYIPASLTNITRPAFSRNPSLMNFHVHEDNPEFRSIDGVWFTRDMKELRHFPQGRGGRYTIPDGIERIRDEAFRFNREIEAIRIPNSVTWIGKQAFRDCEKLTELILPENLESLVRQGRHFMNCVNLKRMVIPDAVTSIPQYTFNGCTNLEEVVLPRNLEEIHQAAFQDCTSLTRIAIPAGLRRLRGGDIFAGCNNLEGILFLGNAPEVSGSNNFPPGVTIYRTANATGWPEPGQLWNGRPTAIYQP